jgi:hypothetical protein
VGAELAGGRGDLRRPARPTLGSVDRGCRVADPIADRVGYPTQNGSAARASYGGPVGCAGVVWPGLRRDHQLVALVVTALPVGHAVLLDAYRKRLPGHPWAAAARPGGGEVASRSGASLRQLGTDSSADARRGRCGERTSWQPYESGNRSSHTTGMSWLVPRLITYRPCWCLLLARQPVTGLGFPPPGRLPLFRRRCEPRR